MTLREFIDVLLDVADGDDTVEVVTLTDDGGPTEEYTPVVAIGPSKDGVRRISVT